MAINAAHYASLFWRPFPTLRLPAPPTAAPPFPPAAALAAAGTTREKHHDQPHPAAIRPHCFPAGVHPGARHPVCGLAGADRRARRRHPCQRRHPYRLLRARPVGRIRHRRAHYRLAATVSRHPLGRAGLPAVPGGADVPLRHAARRAGAKRQPHAAAVCPRLCDQPAQPQGAADLPVHPAQLHPARRSRGPAGAAAIRHLYR